MKIINVNEKSLAAIKKKINEIMTNNDDSMNIKLYHGTDIPSFVNILKTNEICAKKGKQKGETNGINWFSLKYTENFCRGIVFSIEIPKKDFDILFNEVNSTEATAKTSSIDISNYNIKIEKFCDFKKEHLIRLYHLLINKGEKYPIYYIRDKVFYDWCIKTENEDMYNSITDEDFGLLMANIFGEDIVKKDGFINEAAPEVDEYEIGDGGSSYHVIESTNYDDLLDDNGIISLAIERYGITSNLNQAGYILPDGSLLNFGSNGSRDTDHRNIASVYKENNIPIWSDEYKYNYVVDFMNHGAIRCDVYCGILDMTQEPTNKQYSVIKTFVRKAVDIDVDFTDDKGNTLHSVSYSDAKPQQVVADIYRYYNEGIKPQGNIRYESEEKEQIVENHMKNMRKELIDRAIKLRKYERGNWCVIDDEYLSMMPRYFQKRSAAIDYKKWLGRGFLVNLDKYQNVNEKSEKKLKNIINEYSADLRLPFEEPEYANKFYIEQYKDWLEDYGKYGSLPSGTLEFWDEIKQAVVEIKAKQLHGRFDGSVPEDKNADEIFYDLQTKLIGPYIKFTNDGKVYVERAISINKRPRGYDNDQRTDFYKQLWKDYNDNVGGCWSYCKDGAQAYCGDNYGYSIILRGYIRTDDIDFIKTVQLNYHYSNEHEIRVKPFAKVELFNFSYGNDTINFDKGLIVSSTYSGNNSKFIGNVGKIDDGFGGITYINRQNKVLNSEEYNNELNKYVDDCIAKGYKLSDIFDYVMPFHEGFAIVKIGNKQTFIRKDGKRLNNEWYDECYSFYNGLASVQIGDKQTFIRQDGTYLNNEWYDFCNNFVNGFAIVKIGEKYTFIREDGKMINNELYDNCYNFENGFAIVKIGDKYTFIREDGTYLNDEWYDYCYDFKNGFATVRLGEKWYKIDTSGKRFTAESVNKNNKKLIMNENQLITIKENIESEVESNEIDLSSFKKNDTLAKRIWDGMDLNSRVRLKLLDIADDFWKFVNLTWVKPKNIILTGSICNFNWSDESDIDLHLVVDFKEVDDKVEFVKQYLDSKKNEWNNEHKGLQIMGYQVEIYVQNVGEMPESNGIYDLEENDWIKKPDPNAVEDIKLNKFQIKDKAAKIMTIIDDMYDALSSSDDSHKIEIIADDANYLWNKIKEMRRASLDKRGENGNGNIVYKYMRRKGYLDKLWRLRTLCYDKTNSITESKEIIKEYLEKDNNLPLYKYFKWASTASSCEKARDLAYSCSYYINEYIRKIYYKYSEFENLLNDDEFDYEDDSLVEMFLNMLEDNNLCDHFVSEMQNIVDYYELPAWCTMDFNRIVKNEWCIHFGSDSEKIAREGFTGGTPEIENLAYTNAGAQKTSAGYDFAFLINDRSVDYNGYGDEAVIFRTSGIEIYHYGDNQNQVLFWGPNVKSFIPIHQDNGDWVVYGQNGQVLVRCGRPSEIALWATENLPQYRKQIMTGKNGYIPKMDKWNAETNKYERVPYPIYRNESVKKYITLLKENLINEEFALDGNTEHNPFKKRWEAERKALKDFICNNGVLMQSREDNKNGKLYKCFTDTWLSSLIGYNYCLCVQWDEIKMKPKSVVYIRALDKFTPNIKRNITFDNRGFDNVRNTYDDVRNY